jgi:outer membrane protein assembly factor BamB
MVVTRDVLEERRRVFLRRQRIIWLTVLGVICLAIIFLALYRFTEVIFGVSEDIQSVPQSGEWAMFRRDPMHTGSIGPNDILPKGKLAWTFATDGAIHSSPAVIDGTVYFGSRDNYIYALDAITGEKRWSFKTGSWVESSPIVVNGIVYCGSNDGNLYALEAKTGAMLWSFSTRYAIRSSPAIADGVIYVGSDDYGIYAVDVATGIEIWHRMANNLVVSSPIITGGIVVVGSIDGTCYTLNAKNGRPRLQYQTRAPIVASPAVKDGVAYFTTTGGYLYAIDIAAKNWPLENKLRVFWQALYIYGAAPKPPNSSGFLWLYPLGWGVRASSSPSVVDNILYLGAGNSFLALDIETRKPLWTYKTDNTIVSSPAVAGTTIYFGGQDGKLYALDRATGEKLWDISTGDEITSSPAVANGMVYIGSHDGKLYAFN